MRWLPTGLVLGLAACHLALPLSEGEDASPPPVDAQRPTEGLVDGPSKDMPRSCVDTVAGGLVGYVDGKATVARFHEPRSVAVGSDGTIYVADAGNHRLRAIRNGSVSTVAGTGTPGYLDGPALLAQIHTPTGVAVHGGMVYIADSGNHRIRRLKAGTMETVAGTGDPGSASGTVYTAQFNTPVEVAIDAWGVIHVADQQSGLVRRITGGTVAKGATVAEPAGITVDGVGTLYATTGAKHRVVGLGAKVTTLAGSTQGFAEGAAGDARFDHPHGVAVAGDGAIIVADTGNHRIRRIKDGQVSTLAGRGKPGADDGALGEATFNGPTGLGLSPDGKLYVADTGNHRVRVITCGLW